MGWFAAAAPIIGGALGGLLGGGKKMPDLSTLSKEERSKITKQAVAYFSEILKKKHLYTPAQLNSFLAPLRAINAANFSSATRGATEVALGSGQGARSGSLANKLAEAARSRTAADRSGANALAQLEAKLLPSMQMQSAGELGQIAARDASLGAGAAAFNAQQPSRLEAGLAGAVSGLGQVNWGAFGGGGGKSLTTPSLSSGWNVGAPGVAPPSVGGGTQPGINLNPALSGGGGYGNGINLGGSVNTPSFSAGPRIQLPDGRWI